MLKALQDNKGATLIINVVMIVVLLGMAAVAVDTGAVAVQSARLQKAVDAAVLAAALELPNTGLAEAAAEKYITLNGYSPSDISVTFADNNRTIVMQSEKSVGYTFARIFGLSSTMVRPSAKAQYVSLGEAFNYVIFSGSNTALLTLNGSKYNITGSTHTNNSFAANGTTISISGACEAMGTITVNGSHINIPTRVPNASFIAMPDFAETIRIQAEAIGTVYNGDKTFYGSSIDVTHPIYVNGNVTINGSGFKGVGCILATGSITFNGSSQYISSTDSICIYSKSGNITVNGSSSTVDGILYAPSGAIVMNGSHQTVNGRVIANTVNMNGSDFEITVKGSIDDLNCLPPKAARLIQ